MTESLLHGGVITHAGHGRERIVIADSPRLVADYYAGTLGRPLIVFAHGSEKKGRRGALARILAGRLAADGFPVLALDLAGFGESEDPASPLEVDFRFEDALGIAARYAVKRGLAQPGHVVYVGHSLGAGVALRAGVAEPRPLAIVAIGAPFTQRDDETNGEEWTRRFAKRRLDEMEMVADDQSLEVMGRYLLAMDPVNQLGREGQPPVLLVYGELERKSHFVREYLTLAIASHALHVVPRAPHAYYIADGPFGLVVYNREMLDSLTEAIGDWALGWDRRTSGGE